MMASLHAQPADPQRTLDNFLDAYNKLPSPKLLLEIASTLRELGRLADVANTYQRYVSDPAADRVAEITAELHALDAQLAILTIHVAPRGSEISIDAGPFVAVGATLVTRVAPGLHLVRIRRGDASSELTVNGFPGAAKDVALELAAPPADAPDHVDGWLITGPPRVRTAAAEPAPIPPKPDDVVEPTADALVEAVPERTITSGVVGVMRIDGKGRGFAGGLGLAYTPDDSIELELAGLKSDAWGAYLGLRYRLRTDRLRPYVGLGVPLFFFSDATGMSRTAIGARAAGGLEVSVTGHISVLADLGVEHFFNTSGLLYRDHVLDDTVFVPTVGVIGRM